MTTTRYKCVVPEPKGLNPEPGELVWVSPRRSSPFVGVLREALRSPWYVTVYEPPGSIPACQGTTTHPAWPQRNWSSAWLETEQVIDRDSKRIHPIALTRALESVLPGLPVDVYWPPIKAQSDEPLRAARYHQIEEDSSARLGRYHLSADCTGSTVISLSTAHYEDGISTSQLLAEVVFPLYAALAYVSSGAYHRLMGLGGRAGLRRLRWRFDVSDQAIRALRRQHALNRSGGVEAGETHDSLNRLAGLYVRGHNLTRFRGSPGRIVSSVASRLLEVAGQGAEPATVSDLFRGLEAIRTGQGASFDPVGG